MGVYINMEMPKSCSRCFCMATCRLWKNIMHPEFNRHRNCPLVPVPKHGDLIDRAELVDSFDPSDFWNPSAEDNCFAAIHVVNCAPTIIPAEEARNEML